MKRFYEMKNHKYRVNAIYCLKITSASQTQKKGETDQ